MNRTRRGLNIPAIIIIGTLAGVIFLLYEQWTGDSDPELTPPVPLPAMAAQTGAPEATPATSSPQTAIPAGGGDSIIDASILIPSAGVYANIIRVYLDGVSWNIDDLGNNVGHLEGTDWLGGAPGNIVLSGHVELRDGSAGIFAGIKDLNPGDLVVLAQGDEEQRYSVTEVYMVEPDDLTPVYPTTSDRLTLITCDDYDFIRNIYEERIIVVAERMG